MNFEILTPDELVKYFQPDTDYETVLYNALVLVVAELEDIKESNNKDLEVALCDVSDLEIKVEKLETELDEANKRIAELVGSEAYQTNLAALYLLRLEELTGDGIEN